MQITRKIGLNRGNPRLWIEGAVLSDNGFTRGDRFSIASVCDAVLGQVLTIVRHSDGNRKIAGTVERPIIDINGAKALTGFAHGDVVKLSLSNGLIVITKGE